MARGVGQLLHTDSECTDVEASSVASDQDRFDTAYDAFRDLANGLYHIDLKRYSRGITSEDAAVPLLDGQEKLQELVHLPRTWPLARLTIPLEGLSKQIDRLLLSNLGNQSESRGTQWESPSDGHASHLDLGRVPGRYYCVAHAKYSGP